MTHPYLEEIKPNEFGFVGEHPKIQIVCKMINHLASLDVTVNVQGESGTGKEFIARALHNYSFRNEEPFIAINCGVFTESLLEAELFGTERGRAIGVDAYPGLLEQAHKGTLFLDEITEMSTRIQVALLRALQERKIVRIGGNVSKPKDISFRLITASSRKLEGTLREDFYYRITQVPIDVPPLRERGDDVGLLAKYFCGKESDRVGKELYLSDETLEFLSNYSWPGNVRQLENAVIRASALHGINSEDEIKILMPSHFDFLNETSSKGGSQIPMHLTGTLNDVNEDLNRAFIVQRLKETEGNITKAASSLGIIRTTLIYKLKKYGINPHDYNK